jgi:hypothetical protein
MLTAQCFKCGQHVIAKMAIGSAVERQDGLIYLPHP